MSPKTWEGLATKTHPHVYFALFLGGLVTLPCAVLVWRKPGQAVTRFAIAIAQMAFGTLLIHLTGGRIETHFHVFGSLAFLAFYRDYRVLLVASAVIILDHVFRGAFWPESAFGVVTVQPLRWFEHAGWVAFEDAFLIVSCVRGQHELTEIASRHAKLESQHDLERGMAEAREASRAKKRVPREHEPRDPHPDDLHHRLRRSPPRSRDHGGRAAHAHPDHPPQR